MLVQTLVRLSEFSHSAKAFPFPAVPFAAWHVDCMQCLPSQFLHLLLQGQTGPRMHDLSPEPVVHLSQHKLLPLMLHRAHKRGGQDSIRFGHQLQRFQQSPDGVTCTVQTSQVVICSHLTKVLLHCLLGIC